MKKIREAVRNYVENYGAQIAMGYLMMSGGFNKEMFQSLSRRA